ncbi:hypothetical protein BCR37DRAFT_382212 [Protomyces lactucae-debilis]|uniref:Uncharacterized protein n=1 Tax=Protomyces lactucae-debilis TaxID=2754530 RepID=A0A1Y2F6K8_PROLT|nr:uncharacterized protein BCR37DRAFT_382212 [Protomyces lactucae-debilis]ORY78565.1 hypothetical protein BCR37DRAFT_382212 [Protomyces lactucae-debilis]
MGASLSPAGSHSAGTLSPYVQRKQSKVVCALTCCHVAHEAPADLGTITRKPAEFVNATSSVQLKATWRQSSRL